MSEAPTVRVVPIQEVRLDPANTRLHPQRNRSVIKNSIERFGAARSGVIDADGVVRAGNGTLEQAIEAGVKEVVIVESDGSRLVLVQRQDWTPDEAAAYALVDNRATDLSEFDYRAVAELVPRLETAGIQLEPLGWEAFELEPLRNAQWRSPEATGDLGVDADTSRVTDPIRVTAEQRNLFERVLVVVRERAGGGLVSEGEALAMVCHHFLSEEVA